MIIQHRAAWGARPPKRAIATMAMPAPEVWLHHGASPNAYRASEVPGILRAYQDYHMSPGWAGTSDGSADIAYTFGIDLYGTVWMLRGPGKVGAHTKGRNSRSHGIVLVGNFQDRPMSPAMEDSVIDLLVYGQRQGWWPEAKLSGGHRDVGNTTCPGNHAYNAIGRINERARTGDVEQGGFLMALTAEEQGALAQRVKNIETWGHKIDDIWGAVGRLDAERKLQAKDRELLDRIRQAVEDPAHANATAVVDELAERLKKRDG